MEVWTVLAVIFLVVVGTVWLSEQREWVRFHATTGREPEAAARLHHSLLRECIRTRYKLSGTGWSMSHAHSGSSKPPS